MFTRSRAITAAIAIIFCAAVTASAQQDFGFSTSDGQSVTLSSMRGNVAVLLFSGVQDPQRREGLKALEALADRFQGKEVKFFWVSINPATELTNDQLKSMAGASGSVRVLRDTNQAAFKRFSGKIAQLPTIVVLDPQGNPFGQPRGGFNPNSDFINDLASIIDRLLQRK
ncbi:MAG: redoxin domain-containing protein [Acidobacteriota bacterium]